MFVGLELVECSGERCVLIRRILQFDNRERQAVHEEHDVGSAVVLSFYNRELVYRNPIVIVRVFKIHEPYRSPVMEPSGRWYSTSTPSVSIR